MLSSPTFERMAAGGGPGSGVGGQAGRQQERPPPQGSHDGGSGPRQKTPHHSISFLMKSCPLRDRE